MWGWWIQKLWTFSWYRSIFIHISFTYLLEIAQLTLYKISNIPKNSFINHWCITKFHNKDICYLILPLSLPALYRVAQTLHQFMLILCRRSNLIEIYAFDISLEENFFRSCLYFHNSNFFFNFLSYILKL